MSIRSVPGVPSIVLVASLGLGAVGCGKEEIPYVPRPASSGAKATLPAVPNVPKKPIKAGDAYTIWGVSYTMRSRVHTAEVAGKKLKLTGYIVKTNLPDAPECAVHEAGKADPEGCKAAVPTFWMGDGKDDPEADTIKVMGWASNYAQIYDAIDHYEKAKDKKEEKPEPYMDTYWAVAVPNPLPSKGAKITIEGNYSTTFTRSTKGTESDPIMGIMTYDNITVVEPAPEEATLPGKEKKK